MSDSKSIIEVSGINIVVPCDFSQIEKFSYGNGCYIGLYPGRDIESNWLGALLNKEPSDLLDTKIKFYGCSISDLKEALYLFLENNLEYYFLSQNSDYVPDLHRRSISEAIEKFIDGLTESSLYNSTYFAFRKSLPNDY